MKSPSNSLVQFLYICTHVSFDCGRNWCLNGEMQIGSKGMVVFCSRHPLLFKETKFFVTIVLGV